MTSGKKGSGRLHKRADGNWAVEYRFTVPLDTDDRRRAESLQAGMWHQIEALRGGLVVPAVAPALVGIDAAWDRFVASREGARRSAGTLRTYGAAWRSFAAWAAGCGVVTCDQVTAGLVDEWVGDSEREKAAGYVRLSVSACRCVMRVALGGTAGRNVVTPFDGVRAGTSDATGHRPFTDEEVAKIMGAADGELLTACMILAYTGQRLGDAVTWPTKQIDMDRRVMWRVQAKKGKRVHIPIHERLWERLVSVEMGREYVIPGMAESYAARSGAVHREFRRLFEQLHIFSTDDGIVGTHSFRYAFVTRMRESGVPDGVIQELVGHGSKALTDHYSRVGIDATTRAVVSLPAWGA